MRPDGRVPVLPIHFLCRMMSTLTIQLSDVEKQRLDRLAREAEMTPEEVVADLLRKRLHAADEKGFDEAVQYVLEKNDELYRRLA